MPYRPVIIQNIPSSTEPAILRARLHHAIIRQVNNNTIAIGPPRGVASDGQANSQAVAAQYEQEEQRRNTNEGIQSEEPPSVNRVRMVEIRRQSSTVRVFNPDDEEQFVDVSRIDAVLMYGSDGKTYELRFTN